MFNRACVSTTQIHGLTLPHLLFPLFYSRAVHFSHLRGFWALSLSLSAKNLPL
jgi:hypothetical protein